MIADTAGVILAGGKSSRFGSNKALALVDGKPMIACAIDILEDIFSEHLLVTNSPEEYSFTGWDTTPDIYPGAGPLAGIHAALAKVKSQKIFVVGCDMPFLNPEVICFICDKYNGDDIIIPETEHGLEPLHGLYHKNCLEPISSNLQAQQRRLHFFFKEMQTTIIPWQEMRKLDPGQTSFRNINFQHDLTSQAPQEVTP
jgi:molybdopterin-guanine dinucleotide biosynthesis protein A